MAHNTPTRTCNTCSPDHRPSTCAWCRKNSNTEPNAKSSPWESPDTTCSKHRSTPPAHLPPAHRTPEWPCSKSATTSCSTTINSPPKTLSLRRESEWKTFFVHLIFKCRVMACSHEFELYRK